MRDVFKRIMDICIAIIGLIIVGPIILVVSIAIKLTSPGPVLFIQDRVGKDGLQFRMYKFRSMKKGSEITTHGKYISEEEEHITKVGKFLRRWALDELPQLVNILKGDMSFVGPRPTLKYQVDKYNDFQRRRLNVKPGLTGWAQVKGRNMLNWPERIELDVWYADNWTLLLDIKIIFMTTRALIKKEFSFAAEDVEVEIKRVNH